MKEVREIELEIDEQGKCNKRRYCCLMIKQTTHKPCVEEERGKPRSLFHPGIKSVRGRCCVLFMMLRLFHSLPTMLTENVVLRPKLKLTR